MVVIHRVFRRESRLLIDLVGAVRPGDTARAAVLAGHLRDYLLGLHNHHHGEDELLWPPLLARVDLEADLVLRMEAQHERIAATLSRVELACAKWTGLAAEDERDALVAALAEHRAVLVEHLDDEETHLLPLAARHLTVPEWNSLGEHFLASTPKSKLLAFLGMVLEEADPRERAVILGGLPRPARVIWHTVGRLAYPRLVRRVRG
ncbi:hemerythrin domain-containing protein [Solihabitans fulvus]|uniref:Hemerythrin domain-containing protein n=2 Tax=Solihabitans fulvus TaxID=1892852 RepID=A0A5B2WKY5_9PSEU|nr:hemerythrin domain-containing protein [Solihabitans fulvus]